MARRGRPSRTGQRSRNRLALYLDDREIGSVRRIASKHRLSLNDTLRLGLAALDAEFGGDPDEPRMELDCELRDRLRLYRFRKAISDELARATHRRRAERPDNLAEAIRRIVDTNNCSPARSSERAVSVSGASSIGDPTHASAVTTGALHAASSPSSIEPAGESPDKPAD